ncbi:MAG: TIGR02391 family protein [Candidatus Odinarchaeota archaeon]
MLNKAKKHVDTLLTDDGDLEQAIIDAIAIAEFLKHPNEIKIWLKNEYSGYKDTSRIDGYREITFIPTGIFTARPVRAFRNKMFIRESISEILRLKAESIENAERIVQWRADNQEIVYLEYRELERLTRNIKTEICRYFQAVLGILDTKLTYKITFHPPVWKVISNSYQKGDYFHAVHEAAKAYIKFIKKESSLTNKDGESLMRHTFGENGPLKINKGVTDSDKNEQMGIMFLSMGITKLRNITSHEPETDVMMDKEEALAIISTISYLWRKVDGRIK